MLSGLQTGDVLALVLRREMELTQRRLDPLGKRRQLRHGPPVQRGLRLPETGNFRLGYIELDEQASVSKAGYMVLQLRAWSNVANYGVMQYQNSVLILFQDWHDYPVGEQLLFRERWDELLTLLGAFLFLCIWETRARYFFQFMMVLLCAGAMFAPKRTD